MPSLMNNADMVGLVVLTIVLVSINSLWMQAAKDLAHLHVCIGLYDWEVGSAYNITNIADIAYPSVVSLSKALYPLLSTGSTRGRSFRHD